MLFGAEVAAHNLDFYAFVLYYVPVLFFCILYFSHDY